MQMIPKSEINGRYYLKNDFMIPASEFSDEFLRKGVNVYEVLRISEGVPLFTVDHCERFASSLQGTGINFRCSSELFNEKINRLIRENGLISGNIKIVYHYSESEEPFLILYPVEHYYPGEDQYKMGVACTLLQEERPDPALKSWRPNFKDKIMQIREEKKVYEVILVTHEGIITEGSQSNLFFIEDNKLVTALQKRILVGITRKYVFQICKSSGIEIVEEDFGISDLSRFQAAFLSGTSPKILPVSAIDMATFDPGHPLLSLVMREYDKIIKKHISA
ncbi:MAG: aminotransferase class IV [Bacteroidales bacterium]|nr:aminotransferase class IV [Bacteroidales bacterium]